MDKGEFRQAVLDALEKSGLSVAEVARRAEVNYDIVRDLKRRANATTSAENAQKIARALGIAYPQEIQGSSHLNENKFYGGVVNAGIGDEIPENGFLVPVFDVSASAGYGAINEYEPQTHSLAFPPDYLKKLTSGSPQNLAIISVKGDSMEPTLLDDDIVLLDTSKRNLGYDGLFVLLMDEVLHVKRIGRSSKTGHVSIISDNSTFPSLDREMGDIEPIGKVLWYGRKV